MESQKINNFKPILTIGFILILSLSVATLTAAQTKENKSAAIKEIGDKIGVNITSENQAREICSQERYLTLCAEIGKKHSLYNDDKVKDVDAVLEQLKGQVVEDLKNCATTECFVNVADKISKQIAVQKPELAAKIELTQEKIQAKKEIVNTARELGVNIDECQAMDPDSASIELLRSCAKLAKDSRVQKFIPKQAVEASKQTDSTIKLKEALAGGKYQCGDNTLQGCQRFCLNPDNASAEAPEVCGQIAREIFGEEGVKELKNARSQVGQVRQFYDQKIKNLNFVTGNGEKIVSPEEIGRYIETQAKAGNIAEVQKGMDFMEANGFISGGEKEFALKMIKEMASKGGAENFDKCRINPDSCAEFVPQDFQGEFGAMREADKVFKEEMAKAGITDPRLCNDPSLGDKCFEASKNAIPRLEAIGNKSPETVNFLANIKRNIEQASQGFEARKQAETAFQSQGKIKMGDREFNNFQEMEAFCRENGQVCLAASAQQGFVNKDFAVQKYEQSIQTANQFQNFQPQFPSNFQGTPQGNFQFPGPNQFPGSGEGVQNGFPGQGFGPPQQFGGQSFGLPNGISKEEALSKFKAYLDNPNANPPPFFGPPQGSFQTGDPNRPSFGNEQGQFQSNQNFNPQQIRENPQLNQKPQNFPDQRNTQSSQQTPPNYQEMKNPDYRQPSQDLNPSGDKNFNPEMINSFYRGENPSKEMQRPFDGNQINKEQMEQFRMDSGKMPQGIPNQAMNPNQFQPQQMPQDQRPDMQFQQPQFNQEQFKNMTNQPPSGPQFQPNFSPEQNNFKPAESPEFRPMEGNMPPTGAAMPGPESFSPPPSSAPLPPPSDSFSPANTSGPGLVVNVFSQFANDLAKILTGSR